MALSTSLVVGLVISVVLFVVTLLAVPLIVVRIPADYFTRPPRTGPWDAKGIFWFALKNLAGLVLLVMGIIMLVTPGQGVITILLGLSLMSIPGKKKVLLAIIRRKSVYSWISKVRAKAGQPPLELPEKV